ncbi:acyltransferase family protein [Escherichia coli]|uniref:acyltransferase family protein n=1 Tax=Escherichia coli TaxID=562 RepID=UPI000D6A0D89|nr:acyltransferase [Escherichia coli]
MIRSLQALRFIAAFAIVIYHAFRQFGLQSDNFYLNAIYSILKTKLEFGVDIFFVISGYVIYSSYQRRKKSPLEFITDRIIRIAPMYWITTMMFVIILSINFSLYPISDLSFLSVIKSFMFIPAYNLEGIYLPVHSVGWSLNIEMMFYAVFAFAIAVNSNNVKVIVFPAIILIYLVGNDYESLSFYHNAMVFEFLAGCCIAMINVDTLKFISRRNFISSIILMCCIASLIYGNAQLRLLYWGVPSFFIVLICVSFDHKIKVSDWLMTLGAASYSLYLIHRIVITLTLWAFGRGNYSLWFALLSVVISIPASVIMYLKLEKPLSSNLKRISDNSYA